MTRPCCRQPSARAAVVIADATAQARLASGASVMLAALNWISEQNS